MVMTETRPRCLLAAACVAAAGLLAACDSPHVQPSSPGTSVSGAPTANPAPTSGLVRSPHGLTDRLVLTQTHVTAGTSIKGWLVVTYRGQAPINLNRGCQPRFAVVLTNHRFPADVAFPQDCSAAPFMIDPGENRLAVTVDTTYRECAQVAAQATRDEPVCRHGRQIMPPLPAGRYEAVLVGDGLPLPAPDPIPVSLTAGS